ncbi:hypothetical protein PFISCL1PPCAC_21165, partial [Pristionchus fissidentatus]
NYDIRRPPRFDFTSPDERDHDIALIVQGKKIYASKQYLALHSPVFEAMFFGNYDERDRLEIEIKDFVYEEFMELLCVLYPSYEPIKMKSVEFLLNLGDRYEIKRIIDLAEEFLIDCETFTVPEKLLFADEYRLYKLQDHCLSTFKSIEEVIDLK